MRDHNIIQAYKVSDERDSCNLLHFLSQILYWELSALANQAATHTPTPTPTHKHARMHTHTHTHTTLSFILALDGCWCSMPLPGQSTPEKKASTHCIGWDLGLVWTPAENFVQGGIQSPDSSAFHGMPGN